jgi:hypothetical protein
VRSNAQKTRSDKFIKQLISKRRLVETVIGQLTEEDYQLPMQQYTGGVTQKFQMKLKFNHVSLCEMMLVIVLVRLLIDTLMLNY